MLEAVDEIWQAFESEFKQLFLDKHSNDHQRLKSVLGDIKKDAYQFAAIDLIRRVLGHDDLNYFANVEDLQHLAKVETEILNFAREQLCNYH